MDPSLQKNNVSSIKDKLITAMNKLTMIDDSSRLKLQALIVAYASCVAKIAVDGQGGSDAEEKTKDIRDTLNTAFCQAFGTENSQLGNEVKEFIISFTQASVNKITHEDSDGIYTTNSALEFETESDGKAEVSSEIEQTVSQGSSIFKNSTGCETGGAGTVVITDESFNRKPVSQCQTVSERLESQLPPEPFTRIRQEPQVASREPDVNKTMHEVKCLDRKGSNKGGTIAGRAESDEIQSQSFLNESREIEPKAPSKLEDYVRTESSDSEVAGIFNTISAKTGNSYDLASDVLASNTSPLSGDFEGKGLQNSEIDISGFVSKGIIEPTANKDCRVTLKDRTLGRPGSQGNVAGDISRTQDGMRIGETLSKGPTGTTADTGFTKSETKRISASEDGFQGSFVPREHESQELSGSGKPEAQSLLAPKEQDPTEICNMITQ